MINHRSSLLVIGTLTFGLLSASFAGPILQFESQSKSQLPPSMLTPLAPAAKPALAPAARSTVTTSAGATSISTKAQPTLPAKTAAALPAKAATNSVAEVLPAKPVGKKISIPLPAFKAKRKAESSSPSQAVVVRVTSESAEQSITTTEIVAPARPPQPVDAKAQPKNPQALPSSDEQLMGHQAEAPSAPKLAPPTKPAAVSSSTASTSAVSAAPVSASAAATASAPTSGATASAPTSGATASAAVSPESTAAKPPVIELPPKRAKMFRQEPPTQESVDEDSGTLVLIRDTAPAPFKPTAVASTTPQHRSQMTSQLQTAIKTPDKAGGKARIFMGAAYLNAHYDRLESQLQNGATTLSLGIGKVFQSMEMRVGLEIGHGLDQAVTPQNTRMLLVRGDALRLFRTGPVAPFVRIGLGYASVNVRSYRAVNGNTLEVREHVRASTPVAFPGLGVRLPVGRGVTVDLTTEFAGYIGTPSSSAVSGWQTGAALGLPF